MAHAIAIDDFGTGYSNLARLRSMPLDRVKLDPSLIADIDTREKARVIVQAVIQLIKGVGCEVVAEAVETVAQADILRAMGCDTVQGYVFRRADVRGRIPRLDRQRKPSRREVGRLTQHLPNHSFVDARQGANVLDGGAFVDLVHRRVRQAEVDHRAKLNQEAPVGGAAAGREFRLRSGFFLDRFHHHVVEPPRRRQERLARDARADTSLPGASRSAISSTSRTRSAPRCRLLKRMLSCAVADPGMTLLAWVGVSIAGELEVRRREGVGAVVEMERVERGDHPGQRCESGLSARCG